MVQLYPVGYKPVKIHGGLSKETLDSIAADVDQFARAGPDDRDDVYNLWEATGGRATLRFGGLLETMF